VNRAFLKHAALLAFYEQAVGTEGAHSILAVSILCCLPIEQAACLASLAVHRANPDNDLGGPQDGGGSYVYLAAQP